MMTLPPAPLPLLFRLFKMLSKSSPVPGFKTLFKWLIHFRHFMQSWLLKAYSMHGQHSPDFKGEGRVSFATMGRTNLLMSLTVMWYGNMCPGAFP
eukprot:894580-Karenia_brevis.AAC.1